METKLLLREKDRQIIAKNFRTGTLLAQGGAPRGQSAYEQAVEGGYTGTKEEFEEALASGISEISENIEDVATVADAIEDVEAVAADLTDIHTVAENITDVNSVATDISNVNTVAGISSDISQVASISSAVSTVSAHDSDVTLVSDNMASVMATANSITDVQNVASDITNINTVAGISSDVSTVATNSTAVNTAATNIAAIIAAPTAATNAANSAAEAQIWAEGTDGQVSPLGGEHSSKGWAAVAKQYAESIGAALKYKGSVSTYSALPSTGQEIGDMWNVLDTGKNYAWTGTEWDDLSGVVDLSAYRTAANQDIIDGNLSTAITNHTGNTSNPHSVTKAQVGLGNVDNTSDLNKPISTATQSALNAKQDALVSGTNIKTVNGNSLLGSGNVDINGLPSQTGHSGKFLTTDGTDASWATIPAGVSADGTTIENVSNVFTTIGVKDQNTATANKFWTGTKAEYDAIVTKDPNTTYRTTDEDEGGGSGYIPSGVYTEDNLVAGKNISMVKSYSVEQASDFDQGYLQTIIDKNPTTSLDVVLHFKTPSSPSGSGGRITNIFMAGGATGIHFQQYQFATEPIRMWLYGNGQTICSDVNFAGPIAANTDVWFRLTWDGTQYNTYAKTNALDNWVLQNTVSNSIPVYFGGNYTAFGSYVNGSTVGNLAEGIFYAKDSYIKVDNEYVFNGLQNNFEVNGNLTVVGSSKTFINGTGADTSLSNLTNAGKIQVTSLSAPSDTYEDLTLGTSGVTYTAPADGYYVVNFHYTGAGFSRFDWDNKYIAANGTADWNNPYIIPVKKGKTITVTYAYCTTDTFRFYYAEGSKSLA